MKIVPRIVIVAAATLTVAAPVAAHHSYAMFDKTQVVTIKGTLYAVEWKNPHSWIWVMVKGESGKDQVYGIEGGGTAMLTRMGYSKKSFTVGTKVTVQLNPLRDGRPGGNLVKITTP